MTERKLSLPEFDGASDKYQLWKTKFIAYAGVYGFQSALKDGGETEMPATDATALDLTTETGKSADKAKKRNALAMANLTTAMKTNEAMSVVYESYTAEWPQGLAHLVMKELDKTHAPKDTITRVELKKRLNKVKMKRDDNPQTLFEQIANIKNQYLDPKANIKLEEEDLIAQVIAAAPRAYQAVLTAEQLRLGANITMKDISKAMTAQWHATHGGEDNDDNEFSLIT